MRIKRVRFLTIDELSPERREEEIDKHREFEPIDEWWEQTLIDFKEETAAEAGFEVDVKEIMFQLNSQGSGASFAAEVNVAEVLKLLDPDAKRWPAVHVKEGEIVIYITRDERGRYFHSGGMGVKFEDLGDRDEDAEDLGISIAVAQTGDSVAVQLEEFSEAVLDHARTLADGLYKTLDAEHEYLISDESILESIRANEIEFEEGEVEEDYCNKMDRKLQDFFVYDHILGG